MKFSSGQELAFHRIGTALTMLGYVFDKLSRTHPSR